MLTAYACRKVLDALHGGGDLGVPATLYLGRLHAKLWTASTPYSLGDYIVATTFSSTKHALFVITTAGTSGASEPDWNLTAGATTNVGTAVATEVSLLFSSGSFTGAEPTGDEDYARIEIDNTSTDVWLEATGSSPSTKSLGVRQDFAASGADEDYQVGWLFAEAAEGGAVWEWGLNTSLLGIVTGGIEPYYDIGALTSSLGVGAS